MNKDQKHKKVNWDHLKNKAPEAPKDLASMSPLEKAIQHEKNKLKG